MVKPRRDRPVVARVIERIASADLVS